MESVPPPAGSRTSRVPAQRGPEGAPPEVDERDAPVAQPPAAPPSDPAAVAPPAPHQTVRPGPSRQPVRRVLWLVAGALLALLLVAGGAVFIWYDRATTLDRSTPDVTVYSYLHAFLVDRDDVRAGQYLCEAPTALAEIHQLRNEIEAREQQFKVSVRVSWGALEPTIRDEQATVVSTLRIASFSNGQPRSGRLENWRFDLMRSNGWRVCGAERLG